MQKQQEHILASGYFLTMFYQIVRSKGVQGDETAFLPADFDYSIYINIELAEENFSDINIELLKKGAFMALVCDFWDAHCESQSESKSRSLLNSLNHINWFRAEAELLTVLNSMLENPQLISVQKIAKLCVFDWWEKQLSGKESKHI